MLSASYDKTICLWSIQDASGEARKTFQGHGDAVEDVAWHMHHESYFGSVGDDHKLMMSTLFYFVLSFVRSIICVVQLG